MASLTLRVAKALFLENSMLLTELTGLKNIHDKTLSAIIQNLIVNGKYKQHQGAYALVLEPPDKDYVYRAWTNDKGYDKFLEYVRANENKYLIKLIGKTVKLPLFFKHNSSMPESINVQRIEKLVPIKSRLVIETISSCNLFLQKFAKPNAKFDDMVYDAVNSTHDHEELVQEFMLDNKSFFQEYLKIGLWAKSQSTLGIDMHANNVMLRGNTFVITDPFVNGNVEKSIIDLKMQHS